MLTRKLSVSLLIFVRRFSYRHGARVSMEKHDNRIQRRENKIRRKHHTTETYKTTMKANKEQNKIKDVGGYVEAICALAEARRGTPSNNDAEH
jgi:hypothetical protein